MTKDTNPQRQDVQQIPSLMNKKNLLQHHNENVDHQNKTHKIYNKVNVI